MSTIRSGKAQRALKNSVSENMKSSFTIPLAYLWSRLGKSEGFRYNDIVARHDVVPYRDHDIPLNDERLTRLCVAYQKMVAAAPNNSNDPYFVAGLWEGWKTNYQQDFSTALLNSDIETLRDILSSLGSNSASIGISLAGDIANSKRSQMRTALRMNKLSARWKLLVRDPILTPYPQLWGSLPGARTESGVTVPSAYRLHYSAGLLKSLSPNDGQILEIGGGFGGIPFHLFQDHDFNGRYVDFDIPEVLMIAAAFLMATLPKIPLELYGEPTGSHVHSIVLLPHFELENFAGTRESVVFNSHSLTEMSPETVSEYLRQISRIGPRFFLHMNHEYESEFKAPDGSWRSHVNLNSPRFELPTDNYVRISRIPEILTNDGDVYGAFDYWEYLYMARDI